MTNSIPEIRDADLHVRDRLQHERGPPDHRDGDEAGRARRGARLIVADPRAIWLSGIADLHLQLRPGTDVWLLNAMAHVVVSEDLMDQAFIDRHTRGLRRRCAAAYDAIRPRSRTAGDRRAGRRHPRPPPVAYAQTDKAGIYYTLGITEHTHGTDNVYALANLVLMTGHLGKRSAGAESIAEGRTTCRVQMTPAHRPCSIPDISAPRTRLCARSSRERGAWMFRTPRV